MRRAQEVPLLKCRYIPRVSEPSASHTPATSFRRIVSCAGMLIIIKRPSTYWRAADRGGRAATLSQVRRERRRSKRGGIQTTRPGINITRAPAHRGGESANGNPPHVYSEADPLRTGAPTGHIRGRIRPSELGSGKKKQPPGIAKIENAHRRREIRRSPKIWVVAAVLSVLRGYAFLNVTTAGGYLDSRVEGGSAARHRIGNAFAAGGRDVGITDGSASAARIWDIWRRPTRRLSRIVAAGLAERDKEPEIYRMSAIQAVCRYYRRFFPRPRCARSRDQRGKIEIHPLRYIAAANAISQHPRGRGYRAQTDAFRYGHRRREEDRLPIPHRIWGPMRYPRSSAGWTSHRFRECQRAGPNSGN